MSNSDTFTQLLAIKRLAAGVLRQWWVTFFSYRRPVPACALFHKYTKGRYPLLVERVPPGLCASGELTAKAEATAWGVARIGWLGRVQICRSQIYRGGTGRVLLLKPVAEAFRAGE